MCGIAGYVSPSSRATPADDESILRGMTARIAHRGPDADGFYHSGPAHLGHRRLSVLDIAGSAQPMRTPDGAQAVVFNGEIYNFAELRQRLQQLGHVFRTQGDTETLLYAWRQWGRAMLAELTGMFAFALWDETRQSLLLARDHLGVKPLYYTWNGSRLVFGSELKAITAHPEVSCEVDCNALGLYLEAQFIPAPGSIYRHIHKLEPGHALLLQNGQLEHWCYWQPDYRDKLVLDEAEAIDRLDAELRRSVGSMLVADVPLGAFVSGGVDSSLIAALMTDLSGSPVDTFNLGFSGNVVGSEHREAEQVARHIGSRHHALMLQPADVLGALDDWTAVFDEPFGDQAALPTLLLAQLTRQHVTVALTGEGADEVFCGYANYGKRLREERISRVLGHPASPLHYLIRALPAVLRKDRLLKAIGEPLPRRYRTIPNVFDAALHDRLFTPAFRRAQRETMADYAERAYATCNSAHYLDRLLYIDTRLWLPDDLLTKVDRATMAHSLEARVPYLDHKFFEFAARLAPALKQQGNQRKYLLKKLAERYLPRDIVHRPKQGFVMPLPEWLAQELRGELEAALSPQGLDKRGIFRAGVLPRLLAEHQSGKKSHAFRLWALLVLERWFARYCPDFRVGA